MKHLTISFLALSVLVAAEQVDKRDTVWVTQYTQIVETTYETATIWVPYPTDASGPAATTSANEAPPHAPLPAAVNEDSSSDSTKANWIEATSATPVPVASTSLDSPENHTPANPASVESLPAAKPSSEAIKTPEAQAAQDNNGQHQPAQEPAAPAASSGGTGRTYSGEMTYYDPGMGSCGITSTSSEPIVAISHILMDPENLGNPNANPLCGKTIDILYNGKTTKAKIVDRCVGCAEGDLDMSRACSRQSLATWDRVVSQE